MSNGICCRPLAQVGVVFTPLVTYENPPTYFRTNKVTYAFQEIVRTATQLLYACVVS